MSGTVRGYFEQQAGSYDLASERGVWSLFRQREADAVVSLVGECAGRSLLDLGCGAGFYTKRLVNRGCAPVVAVDVSSAMLAQIKDPAVATINGDVASVSAGRKFDIVVAAGVLEFVSDPAAVLANISRHLESRGRAVLLVPPNTVAGRLYRAFHKLHGFNIRLFDPSGLAAMLEAANLRILSHRRVLPISDVYALSSA